MKHRSLLLSLMAIMSVSLAGIILTRKIYEQRKEIMELEAYVIELKDIQNRLEEENESLSDELQDCTEDFQHCLSGRIWTESRPNPTKE